MKILLINPPENYIIKSNVPNYVESDLRHLPSLGLLYIGTYLKQNSEYSVEIFDAAVLKVNYNQIAEKTLGFDLVGITTVTFSLLNVIFKS